MNYVDFKKLVVQKGKELYRDMPWRQNTDPYFVLVSELMLQQTQVDRVIPKFNAFVARFPDTNSLATAPLADVVRLWSGLGYNRRAKFLHDSAKKIVSDFGGNVPSDSASLMSLPGVGSNTAGAIMAYGFNQPTVLVETNIRTVYFYHFFNQSGPVSDKSVQEIVLRTLDTQNPRQWYQALMDYGNYLKKQGEGQISKSLHYKKQPTLRGSVREVRGQIIRELTKSDADEATLRKAIAADQRFDHAVHGLIQDGLITSKRGVFYLTK